MPRILYAGADIRESPDQLDADWTLDRREKYLLRTDAVRPLSVDPNVWGRVVNPDGEASGPLPWISVEDVLEGIGVRAGLGRQVAIVIGVVAEDSQEETAIAREMGADTALEAHASWRLLGFDVANGATSGLSNCGYDGIEASVLRPVWASRLNEHGLFSDLIDALAFRRLTDQRVSEHAPFRVYGLWMVGLDDRSKTQ